MGFAQVRGRLRQVVFSALGDPALLNDTQPIRVRLKARDEAVGFGASHAVASVTHIEVLGSDPGIGRGAVLTLEDGRRFKVSSDPMMVRSEVWRCPVVEVKP